MFADGDLTEIGDKGITLSGGQKARVSLARALYSLPDILLMDDPISALDANLRKEVMQQVILKQTNTRVLVTHSLEYLNLADRILILKTGHIHAFDTF